MQRIAYFDRVIEVLAKEFEWDDTTRGICRTHLGRYVDEPGIPAYFEFICDHPQSALWRLKRNTRDHGGRHGPWGLRIAFYGRDKSCEATAEEITARLL
jgi:hypothetical protein